MKHTIFWFRRDLRLEDNAGLYHALKSKFPVKPIFIFDKNILEKLSDNEDPRVSFIHDTILELQIDLKKLGSDIDVYYGRPEEVWKTLSADENLNAVYTNRDYEKYAINRDEKVSEILSSANIEFKTSKDQVIFEKGEILKGDGTPYVVFTP